MAAAAVHDVLLPRPIGGTGPGAVMSLLAHGLLLAALTFGVNWRSRDDVVFSAELWAAVPQSAAPKPPEPAPQPVPVPTPPTPAPPPPQAAPQPSEADIAVERENKRKAEEEKKRAEAEAEKKRAEKAEAERKKAEADKLKREQQLKAEQAAAEQRQAQLREENLRRMMSQAGTATSGSGTAARDAAPTASYIGRLKKRLRDQITFPPGTTPDNAAVEIELSATPTGSIIARRVRKSSGHKEWDEAVVRAIDKMGTLPPADAGGVIPTGLLLEVRPTE